MLDLTHVWKKRKQGSIKAGANTWLGLLTLSSMNKVTAHFVISQRVEKHTEKLHNHKKERREAWGI